MSERESGAPDCVPCAQPRQDLLDLASRRCRVRNAAAERISLRALVAADEFSIDSRIAKEIDEMWREYGHDRAGIIADLVLGVVDVTSSDMTVEIVPFVIARAGEDGVAELVPLLRNYQYFIRMYVMQALESIGREARWAVPSIVRTVQALFRAGKGYSHDYALFVGALATIGGREAIDVLEVLLENARLEGSGDAAISNLQSLLAEARTRE